jgi:hypothetical protein
MIEQSGYSTDSSACQDREVLSLPPRAEEGLGIEDLAFVLAVRRDGTAQLFRSEKVNARTVKPGVSAKSIDRIESHTFIAYTKNPGCLIYVPPYTAGGMAFEGQWIDICPE